jgi:hypothetical protein
VDENGGIQDDVIGFVGPILQFGQIGSAASFEFLDGFLQSRLWQKALVLCKEGN